MEERHIFLMRTHGRKYSRGGVVANQGHHNGLRRYRIQKTSSGRWVVGSYFTDDGHWITFEFVPSWEYAITYVCHLAYIDWWEHAGYFERAVYLAHNLRVHKGDDGQISI